ncbi:hypothetical protein CUMW_281220 [Citrus unshiu]|uniref:Uncharacterized protein n=1 Tax=Citrus unshiu TaxID=55188 RepID=A0A2H5MYG5_CITUN|nr:hypothetical protein CUMW_281220 [Citrus unshiu]
MVSLFSVPIVCFQELLPCIFSSAGAAAHYAADVSSLIPPGGESQPANECCHSMPPGSTQGSGSNGF